MAPNSGMCRARPSGVGNGRDGYCNQLWRREHVDMSRAVPVLAESAVCRVHFGIDRVGFSDELRLDPGGIVCGHHSADTGSFRRGKVASGKVWSSI